MIYGKLDLLSTWSPLVGRPLWNVVSNNLHALSVTTPLGDNYLIGKDMYVNVHTYATRPADECRFEGHRDMIDVQYVIEGGEYIDWALKRELEPEGEYITDKDFQFYKNPEREPTTRVHLQAGYVGIFFPEDGHRPQISDGIAPGVYKAVVKIHRKLLEPTANE